MKNQHSNHFRMFMSVQDYLDNRNAVWSTIPKINAYKNDFDELIARIAEKNEEARSTVSATERKDQLKEMVALKLAGLSGVLQAFANDIGNLDMAKAVKQTKSGLVKEKDQDVEGIANSLLKTAGDHLNDLADYGITENKLTEISTSVADFTALVGKPRSILNQKYVTLDTIEQLFDECNGLLRNKMDNIMLMFQETNAEFYDGYLRARTIVDR
ncbi:MAG: hypothetical protein ACOC10_01110 [Bacteroidota bacterium]